MKFLSFGAVQSNSDLERLDSLDVDVELHLIGEVQGSLEEGCW